MNSNDHYCPQSARIVCIGNRTLQCYKLLGLALENHQIVKCSEWRCNGLEYALVGFLVSTLFVLTPANPSNFSHCTYDATALR